ncbi:MAG: hypothetical protein ACRDT6_21435 [Micromonosporaceae bacterium]
MTYALHGGRPDQARSLAESRLARDRLGAVAIVFMMLAAAAPFVVVGGLIPQTYGVSGITSVPAAFVATAVILALFSVGYVAMSRHIVNGRVDRAARYLPWLALFRAASRRTGRDGFPIIRLSSDYDVSDAIGCRSWI